MEVVPRGLELMALKRLFRVFTAVDRCAIAVFDDDSGWLEDETCLSPDEVQRQQLAGGIHIESHILGRVTISLDDPQRPGNRSVDGDRGDLVTSIQTPVGGYGLVE